MRWLSRRAPARRVESRDWRLRSRPARQGLVTARPATAGRQPAGDAAPVATAAHQRDRALVHLSLRLVQGERAGQPGVTEQALVAHVRRAVLSGRTTPTMATRSRAPRRRPRISAGPRPGPPGRGASPRHRRCEHPCLGCAVPGRPAAAVLMHHVGHVVADLDALAAPVRRHVAGLLAEGSRHGSRVDLVAEGCARHHQRGGVDVLEGGAAVDRLARCGRRRGLGVRRARAAGERKAAGDDPRSDGAGRRRPSYRRHAWRLGPPPFRPGVSGSLVVLV